MLGVSVLGVSVLGLGVSECRLRGGQPRLQPSSVRERVAVTQVEVAVTATYRMVVR